MPRSNWYRRMAGLALALGLLYLPAAHAAPADRSMQDEDPIGIQQLVRVVRSFFRPIADILSIFQMDSPPPGQKGGDPPKQDPQEGVGVDPFGKPGPPGPP